MGSYYSKNTARGGGLVRILENRCGGWWERLEVGCVLVRGELGREEVSCRAIENKAR